MNCTYILKPIITEDLVQDYPSSTYYLKKEEGRYIIPDVNIKLKSKTYKCSNSLSTGYSGLTQFFIICGCILALFVVITSLFGITLYIAQILTKEKME